MITQFTSLAPLYTLYEDHVVRQPFFLSAGVAAVLLWLFVSRQDKNSRDLSCLPGPKPLPLIGNLHQVNAAAPWLTYTAWRQQYGDLLHVRLLGRSFIILNSEKVARALLDQRSGLYSDRPAFMRDLSSAFGTDGTTVVLPYGDKWRLHRKHFQHAFRAESETRNREVYLQRVRTLLVNLLDAPAQFELHLKSYIASNVMALAYGYETTPRDDPILKTVMSLVDVLTGLSPERSAVLTTFPFLMKLPEWFPGAGVCRDAARSRKLAREVLDVPFDWVKAEMANGTAAPSMVADCLTQLDQTDDLRDQELTLKEAAATVFLAGFETSSSTLLTLALAMVLYPEVQAKAQAEIDGVLGHERLPDFGDRATLPYVDALLRELARWAPLVPLGIPHATSGDDVYEGCRIPKGTTILFNVWAMNRDPDQFTDAESFQPERFLTESGTLKDGPPMSANPTFGFGRRICPGRFASEAFVWTAAVSILAAFRITKARDANGEEIDVQKRFTSGLAIRPVEFACCFVPRSDERTQTIRQSAA